MVRLSPLAYSRVTLVALLALCAIVVTGASVRLTGSGLGCTDWPTCEEGQLAPAEIDDAPAMVEFGNRLITGVVSVAVIVAVLGALWRRPYRRDLTWLAWGLVAGVVAQVLLGGLVVLLELSPKVVMGHFILSMVLVWNAVVLHIRARSDDVRTPPPWLARLTMAWAAVVVFTGTIVTASGPHAGDEAAERLGFYIEDVARVHGTSVVVFIALALALWRLTGSRASVWLLGAIAVQAAIGYTQYFTGVPALLVGFHVVGALAVWVASVRVATA
jgi:cytochrome c oxidase assembly protein subunit 15